MEFKNALCSSGYTLHNATTPCHS